jgi:hypothetical protein
MSGYFMLSQVVRGQVRKGCQVRSDYLSLWQVISRYIRTENVGSVYDRICQVIRLSEDILDYIWLGQVRI